MATTYMVTIGVSFVGIMFVFIKWVSNKEKVLKTTDGQPIDKGPCRASRINYGIRDGEYVICSNCKHNNRVGVGFDRPQFPCDGCGEIIALRGNDTESRHGEIIDAEFDRIDMKDGR